MTPIAIIGDGGWGTALALVLRQNGHTVRVWGHDAAYLADVCARRENFKFLPGVPLPPEIVWSADFDVVLEDVRHAVLVMPSRHFRTVLEKMTPHLPRGTSLLSATKGLDQASQQRMTEVARAVLGGGPVAALSGPSHAEEVGRGIPTAVTVACAEAAPALEWQRLLNGPRFRVYTSADTAGVELGGALKNIIAIAAGACDGLGFGDNTKAALMTRGLAEIARLGCACGAQPGTFAGLSGMGDLVVTCFSRHSRNRGVGERIGRGEKVRDVLASMEQVAEGVWTCAAASALAAKLGVPVPITDQVRAVVHEGCDPAAAVQSLLTRDPRPERDG